MNETELEQLVAGRVAAKRDAVKVPPDFSIRIIRAVDAAGAPRRRPVIRELVVASVLFVFVALLAGGAAWLRSQSHTARPPTPKTSAALSGVRNVRMMTAQVGWALTEHCAPVCSTSRIQRTIDGGLHWTDTTGPLADSTTFFLDSARAWYTVSVTQTNSPTKLVLFSTADGGALWHKSKILTLQAPAGELQLGLIMSLQFVDPQHGWLIFAHGGGALASTWLGGVIYQTVDGGKTWNEIEVTPYGGFGGQPTAGSLPPNGCAYGPVVFTNQTRGWASGSCPGIVDNNHPPAPRPLPFYRTTDGGRTWSRQALPVPVGYPSNWFDSCFCYVSSVQFPDSQNGVILVGSRYVGPDVASPSLSPVMFITRNGGSSWEQRALPAQPGYDAQLLDFVSGSVGWVIEGGLQAGLLYRTDDGGRTWMQVYQLSVVYPAAVDFVDQSHGWGIFSQSTGPELRRSPDGGITWSP